EEAADRSPDQGRDERGARIGDHVSQDEPPLRVGDVPGAITRLVDVRSDVPVVAVPKEKVPAGPRVLEEDRPQERDGEADPSDEVRQESTLYRIRQAEREKRLRVGDVARAVRPTAHPHSKERIHEIDPERGERRIAD